jgi:hypothetical protein
LTLDADESSRASCDRRPRSLWLERFSQITENNRQGAVSAPRRNNRDLNKKVDAIAAVVTKLVEQRKAMHEGMQKMMPEGGKDMMKRGRMMMMMRMMRMMDRMMGSDQERPGESEHSQHH